MHDPYFVQDSTSKFNWFVDYNVNRRIKIWGVIVPNNERYNNSNCLNDAPIKTMPRVLDLLQKGRIPKAGLNSTFLFVREWNMPLLYTSRIGPEPRRSGRLRKNNVMQFMGK